MNLDLFFYLLSYIENFNLNSLIVKKDNIKIYIIKYKIQIYKIIKYI